MPPITSLSIAITAAIGALSLVGLFIGLRVIYNALRSPERLLNPTFADPRCRRLLVWHLGVCLFHLLVGGPLAVYLKDRFLFASLNSLVFLSSALGVVRTSNRLATSFGVSYGIWTIAHNVLEAVCVAVGVALYDFDVLARLHAIWAYRLFGVGAKRALRSYPALNLLSAVALWAGLWYAAFNDLLLFAFSPDVPARPLPIWANVLILLATLLVTYVHRLAANSYKHEQEVLVESKPFRLATESLADYEQRLKRELGERFYEPSPYRARGAQISEWFTTNLPWHLWPRLLGALLLALERRVSAGYNLNLIWVGPQRDVDKWKIQRRGVASKLIDELRTSEQRVGGFLGRNCPAQPFHDRRLTEPPIQDVVSKLLRRRPSGPEHQAFKPAGAQFNVLAAAWVQFQTHDWTDHEVEPYGAGCPAMVRIAGDRHSLVPGATEVPPTKFEELPGGVRASRNTRSPFWNASVIYGNRPEEVAGSRTGVKGQVRAGEQGDIPADVGDQRNNWVGPQLLQALFLQEHNHVCELIHQENPAWTDEQIFGSARLVVAAVISKVHTIDWTVELLKNPTLHIAMNANWHGLLGQGFKEYAGHTGSSLLSGFLGLAEAEDDGIPFQFTEEFSSVYRHLHSMLPDELLFQDGSTVRMEDTISPRGGEVLRKHGVIEVWDAMLREPCGAAVLFNYPDWLRNLPQPIGPTRPAGEEQRRVDLAAIDVYRDRERGVLRYNAFRRALRLPPLEAWRDLTSDAEVLGAIREVYGDDFEQLDLLVGVLAETKPPGFAISETAFRIFIIMASRRLQTDDFYTKYHSGSWYSEAGMRHLQSVGGLADVLRRHWPEAAARVPPGHSAFTPYSKIQPGCCGRGRGGGAHRATAAAQEGAGDPLLGP